MKFQTDIWRSLKLVQYSSNTKHQKTSKKSDESAGKYNAAPWGLDRTGVHVVLVMHLMLSPHPCLGPAWNVKGKNWENDKNIIENDGKWLGLRRVGG